MLSEVAQVRKIQGIITFDPGTRSEKKLHSHIGGTHLHLVSKFHEHLTKIDFIGTYPNFQLFVQWTIVLKGLIKNNLISGNSMATSLGRSGR